MTKNNQLVYTSNPKHWPESGELTFIGEWCLEVGDPRTIPQGRSIPSIDLEFLRKQRLFREARNLEEALLPRIVELLNKFHNCDHSERFWKITLGHWLREACDLVTNRRASIEDTLRESEITTVPIFSKESTFTPSPTYHQFTINANNDQQNCFIYSRIIELLSPPNVKIKKIHYEPMNNFEFASKDSELGDLLSFEKKLRMKIRKLALKLTQKTDAVILNTYLPLIYEFKLALSLKQSPQWRIPWALTELPLANLELREELGTELGLNRNVNGLDSVFKLLIELLPTIYLEGFKIAYDKAKELDLPTKPKFVFTSNSFVYDDLFKIWLASNVQRGVPYYAGQHGNGYGVDRYYLDTIEEETCDKFLTWGWVGDPEKHVPLFVFKNVGRKTSRDKDPKNLLLIERAYPFRVKVWDQHSEFNSYFEEQTEFAKNLRFDIQNNLLIRLPQNHKKLDGNEETRWGRFRNDLKFDNGDIPIRQLWTTSKIVIHSYDSTGLLETLEKNIPTIAFWQNQLSHVVETARPFYEELHEVGIIHFTPQSASQKINAIWDEVDSWWGSEKVQNARRNFCSEYARSSRKPIRELKKILLEDL